MERARFVIEPAEADRMAKNSGTTVAELLASLVESARPLARPPISSFHVGAVGLGSSGRIYFGVNLEFPGLPLHQSVHAEQFLVSNLSLNGEPHLRYLAVSAAPCGHCRQFFQEIRSAPDIKILITEQEHGNGKTETSPFYPLSYFLPSRFGPEDLLEKDVPLILETRNNGLSFDDDSRGSDGGECAIAALVAANSSHAPYSGCPSGVVLVDEKGRVFKGSYMESAAYNPSLGPVQAALVAYVAGGGGGYERIVAATLVEKADAAVKQEHVARMLLQCIAPKCEFKVFHCVGSKKKV